MKPRRRYTRRAIEQAILASDGTKASIAAILGCSRQTLYNHLAADPTLQALIDHQRDHILDLAESKLFEWVKNGDERAVYFILETRGRARGYSRRTELTGASDSGAITFNILPVPSERT